MLSITLPLEVMKERMYSRASGIGKNFLNIFNQHEYAKELSRYIHLNPVRVKVTESPEEYDWSSYRFYIGKHFGIGESGVSQACRRVAHKINSDKKLKRKIGKIEKKIKQSRMKT